MWVTWILALAAFAGSISCSPSRIVGGSPVTIEQYPTLVQVDILNIWSGQWSHGCGGNILTSRYILSAAHCFHGDLFETRLRRIRAGATYRNFGGVIAHLLYVTNHPEFGTLAYEADLSLVRLSDQLIYSPVIQRTAIPPKNTVIPDNLPVVHAGWGVTSHGGSTSETLRDVRVYTINNNVCYDRHASQPGGLPVTKRMICAGLLDSDDADACQGDSGGPMLYGNITIGVISWREGCANSTVPGVSIAIAPFFDWIIENAV